MSTFLTPPVWYGSSGVKDESLINIKSAVSQGEPDNTVFGKSAAAGGSENISGAVAVGYQAQVTGSRAIAIGSYDKGGSNRNVSAKGYGSIAIGTGANSVADGDIAIDYQQQVKIFGKHMFHSAPLSVRNARAHIFK